MPSIIRRAVNFGFGNVHQIAHRSDLISGLISGGFERSFESPKPPHAPEVACVRELECSGYDRWLGWADNMRRAVALYTNLIKTAEGGGKGLVR